LVIFDSHNSQLGGQIALINDMKSNAVTCTPPPNALWALDTSCRGHLGVPLLEGRVAERSPLSCSAPQATLITNVEARWRSPGTLHKNCYNTTIDAGTLPFQTPAAPARAIGPRTGSFVRGHGPVSPPPSHVFGGILKAGCRRCPIARCGNRHSLMAVGRAVGV
jgi:hypothetical protein